MVDGLWMRSREKVSGGLHGRVDCLDELLVVIITRMIYLNLDLLVLLALCGSSVLLAR